MVQRGVFIVLYVISALKWEWFVIIYELKGYYIFFKEGKAKIYILFFPNIWGNQLSHRPVIIHKAFGDVLTAIFFYWTYFVFHQYDCDSFNLSVHLTSLKDCNVIFWGSNDSWDYYSNVYDEKLRITWILTSLQEKPLTFLSWQLLNFPFCLKKYPKLVLFDLAS